MALLSHIFLSGTQPSYSIYIGYNISQFDNPPMWISIYILPKNSKPSPPANLEVKQ